MDEYCRCNNLIRQTDTPQVHLNSRHNGCERQYWCCIPRSPLPGGPPTECATTEAESINKRLLGLVEGLSTQKARLDTQKLPSWTLSVKPYILQSGGSWHHALDLQMGSLGLAQYDLRGYLDQQVKLVGDLHVLLSREG